MELLRPTFLHVHLDRLMNNFRRLKTLHPTHPFLCPMIKANAYGHGDLAVAKALVKENCQNVGVASVEEGMRLRHGHVAANILVFGFYGKESVQEMLDQDLTPVVSNFNQMEILVQMVKSPMEVHLKFNTGMNRLGFSIAELARVQDLMQRNPMIRVEGLCTHLHSGENILEEGSSSQQQIQIFQKIAKQLNYPTAVHHVYNSSALAAIYRNRRSYFFGSRPGLLVYGIDPTENLSLKPLVSPVMELKSKIIDTHQVKSGEVVSYGGTWRAEKDSLVGIVPAGYGDGVNRDLSNSGEMLVRGKRVPILGRVCMDYTMIDLTKLERADFVGDEVVLIGQQGQEIITVEEMAQASDRISYEIMTGISERVPRIYGVLQ